MITAKEMNGITTKALLIARKHELVKTLEKIKVYAEMGLFNLKIDLMYDETLDRLKKLGYKLRKIDTTYNHFEIVWK